MVLSNLVIIFPCGKKEAEITRASRARDQEKSGTQVDSVLKITQRGESPRNSSFTDVQIVFPVSLLSGSFPELKVCPGVS